MPVYTVSRAKMTNFRLKQGTGCPQCNMATNDENIIYTKVCIEKSARFCVQQRHRNSSEKTNSYLTNNKTDNRKLFNMDNYFKHMN